MKARLWGDGGADLYREIEISSEPENTPVVVRTMIDGIQRYYVFEDIFPMETANYKRVRPFFLKDD